MITYELKIKRLEYEPTLNGLSNIVTYIYYECNGTNDENGMVLIQPGRCKAPTELSGEFVEYENLTEDIVLNWVKSSEEYLRLKFGLEYRLDPNKPRNSYEISPTKKVDVTLPWNK